MVNQAFNQQAMSFVFFSTSSSSSARRRHRSLGALFRVWPAGDILLCAFGWENYRECIQNSLTNQFRSLIKYKRSLAILAGIGFEEGSAKCLEAFYEAVSFRLGK